jgi:hypothetical protein
VIEYRRPGALVHVDIKKPGQIGCVGHPIPGDRRTRMRGIGWEFVHWPSMMPPAWPISKSCPTNWTSRVCAFSGAPSRGFGATASASGAS